MRSVKKKLQIKSVSFWALLVIYTTLIWANFNIKRWKEANVIDWDITSYYGYLPALFIHNDITLDFTKGKEEEYANKHQYWPEKAPNGGKVIKMTMGMAMLYSPFFFIAHTVAKLKGYETDGFSEPYEKYIHLSCLFYLFIGLWFLRKTLLIYFNDLIVALVLLFVVLGTNLFYYSTTEAAMSHAYNFSLISLFVYLSIKWHNEQKIITSVIIGFIGGLIILIRPVNILVFIFPFLYQVKNIKDIKSKLLFFYSKKLYLVIIVSCAFVIVLPQLIYWKYVTGNYFFYSYMDERFYFNNPHILEGLFSYRKGWLLYTPVMIFACVGLYVLYKNHRQVFLAISIFFLLNTYVVFSWWSWWYGGSFGLRAMIDCYPLLAIAMAAFFQHLFSRKKLVFGFFVLAGFALLSLNMFQTKQYRNGIIHWEGMTKEAYWQSFGKLHVTDTNYWHLMQLPDCEAAMQGKDEYEFNPF